MSEQQKVFASISGALVAHVIFLIGVFVLLTARSVSKDSRFSVPKAAPAPQEVTVLMGDLLEKVEEERRNAELEKARPTQRRFVDTSLNEGEESKPELARFESDRNTSAASRVSGNDLLPEEEGPTLVGSGSDSDLTLEDRRYNQSETDEIPSRVGEGEARPNSATIPEVERAEAGRSSGGRERIYATKERTGDVVPERPEKSVLDLDDSEPLETAVAGGTENGNDGFSAEQRQDDRNGKAERIGQNAVDAEKTAMGEYKQTVRKTVAKRWHRYREEEKGNAIWGMLKLTFHVAGDGSIKELKITKNEANTTLIDISLRAIRESEFPPMPPEVAAQVGEEGLEIRYDIITY